MRIRFLLSFLLAVLLASPAGPGVITVKITNLPNTSGEVRAALFQSPAGFPKQVEQAMQRVVATFDGPHATAVFTNVPPGQYAIVAIHDLNRNGRLDTNLLGIPREPYGFSNDARAKLGPPSFTAAAFTTVGGSKEITIRMNR